MRRRVSLSCIPHLIHRIYPQMPALLTLTAALADPALAQAAAADARGTTILFSDDVEGDEPLMFADHVGGNPLYNWWSVTTTDWHSPDHSWFRQSPSEVTDNALVMISDVQIPVGCKLLSFWHRFNLEANLDEEGVGYDGGVLEVSSDGGTQWNDILEGNDGRFLWGGYVAIISWQYGSPIANRMAWTGQSLGWQQTVVDLSDYAGESVRFRWRQATDESASDLGWGVDDILIEHGGECSSLIFSDGFESGDVNAWI